jgi:hypothetical protein
VRGRQSLRVKGVLLVEAFLGEPPCVVLPLVEGAGEGDWQEVRGVDEREGQHASLARGGRLEDKPLEFLLGLPDRETLREHNVEATEGISLSKGFSL